jgi:hypothetical protein
MTPDKTFNKTRILELVTCIDQTILRVRVGWVWVWLFLLYPTPDVESTEKINMRKRERGIIWKRLIERQKNENNSIGSVNYNSAYSIQTDKPNYVVQLELKLNQQLFVVILMCVVHQTSSNATWKFRQKAILVFGSVFETNTCKHVQILIFSTN